MGGSVPLGKGCRPVWVRACRWSSSLRVNLFPQKNQLQTKGRSPVCRRTWARSKDVFRKVLPQSGIWHTCFFLPCSPDLRMEGGVEGKGRGGREEVEDRGRTGWREEVGSGQRIQERWGSQVSLSWSVSQGGG